MKKETKDFLFELQFDNDGELFITSDSKTEIKLDLFEQCFLDLFKTLDKTKKHSFSVYNLLGCNQVKYHGVFELTLSDPNNPITSGLIFSDPNNPTSNIIGVLHKNPSFTEKLNMLNQELNGLRIRKNFEDELNAE